MNLRQVEVFLSVVKHGSLSAAARESLLTQSTISQHLKALEDELGVRLLERSRNGIRLTDGGRILQKHGRRLIGELRATEAAFRRYRGIEETTLRIGVSTIPGTWLVPQVLARLSERFPSLDTIVLPGDSRDTMERIANREVEVGVVGSRFDERGFTFAPVSEDRIRLVVFPGHPWAGRPLLSSMELEGGVFIGRETGSGTGRTVMEALQGIGVPAERLRFRAEFGSGEAIKAAVIAGIGAAFLSDLTIRREVERGELVVVAVDGLTIARPFYLARQSGRELTPASAAFWESMLAAYGAGLPA